MITLTKDSDSITLPSPQMEDSETNYFGLTVGKAMSGHIYTYVQTPIRKILTMRFVDVDKTEKDDLESFLDSYIGSLIELTDWLGQNWEGYILTNPLEIVSERNNRYTFELQFEGEQVS